MRRSLFSGLALWAAVLAATIVSSLALGQQAAPEAKVSASSAENHGGTTLRAKPLPQRAPIPEFVARGTVFLLGAQNTDGGWSASWVPGVRTASADAATTAYVAMAMVRTANSDSQRDAVDKATAKLVQAVEAYPESQLSVVSASRGTQPQVKLGSMIDTSMTTLYLARAAIAMTDEHSLSERNDASLDKCLRRLKLTQQSNGSWMVGGGWAPVLQTAVCVSALEMAQLAGHDVDPEMLERARRYFRTSRRPQPANVPDASRRSGGRPEDYLPGGGAAAATPAGVGVVGIHLYSLSAAQRATAAEAGVAAALIEAAIERGELPAGAAVSLDNLQQIGVAPATAQALLDARALHATQLRQLGNQQYLAGFGNMGGEELLSYALISESLVITTAAVHDRWTRTMYERLRGVQNADGSWTGLHCITSRTFCTAAVVHCMTAHHDAAILQAIATNAANTVTGEPLQTLRSPVRMQPDSSDEGDGSSILDAFSSTDSERKPRRRAR